MFIRDSQHTRRTLAALVIGAIGLQNISIGQPLPAGQVAPVPAGGGMPPAASAPTSSAPLTVPAGSVATAAEIQKINEQIALLQAQLNQLELKAKIASKQKEIKGDSEDSRLPSSFDSKQGTPAVVSVSGLKGKLEAVLIFPGGVSQRVKEGDVIDDRRVAKVALNEVVLTDLKGRNVQRLAFGTSPIVREKPLTQAQPGSPPIVPPPPPLPR